LPPPADPVLAHQSALEQKTAEFIRKLFATWPYPGDFESNYSPMVTYYGKMVPRQDVMADKAKFVARWPQRTYVVRNLVTHCNNPQVFDYCTAEAWVDWEVRNGAKMLSGAVHARYEIAWAWGPDPQITLETSEVTSRNQPVASAPPSLVPPPVSDEAVKKFWPWSSLTK
jgi:hypothetical protein